MRRIVESGRSQRGAHKASSDGVGSETEGEVNRRAVRAPLVRLDAAQRRGCVGGERFRPEWLTIGEVAKQGAPPVAVRAVALLEDSQESSYRATGPIRAKPPQILASGETVIVDDFGSAAVRLESSPGGQNPGERIHSRKTQRRTNPGGAGNEGRRKLLL